MHIGAEVLAVGVEAEGAVRQAALEDHRAEVAHIRWPVAHQRQWPQTGRNEVTIWSPG